MGDDITTNSISKGCFLQKPVLANHSHSKKRTIVNRKLSPGFFYPKLENESQTERDQRFEAYQNCWNKLDAMIKDVQQELNQKVFDGLLHFFANAYQKQRVFPIAEIPTAVLVTGVNLPDHETIFSHLQTELKEKITPYIACVKAKECCNLKSMLKLIFNSLVASADQVKLCDQTMTSDTQENNKDDNKVETKKKSSVFNHYTFDELTSWYKHNCDKSVSEDKVNDTIKSVQENSLVFIIEDFESFSPSVLQDFILICSEHIANLPIVLLFGIATTVSSMHQSLPHFVSSHLSVEKFQSQPSIICLTEVIEKVLLTSNAPFKLGPRVFRLLFESFLYHDFLLKNFVKGLQFSVMEHFYRNQFSVLSMMNLSEQKIYINSLTNSQIASFQNIKSFKNFIERKGEEEQKNILCKKQELINLSLKLLEQLKEHERVFFPSVKCLFIITCKLPGEPLGKRLRDTYEYCTISPNIAKDQIYANAMSLVRMLSRDELLPILMSCVHVLEESSDCKELFDDAKILTQFIDRLNNLDNIEELEVVTEKEKVRPLPVFKNRYDLQEKMKLAAKDKRKESPYEKLRNEVVVAMDTIFKKNLPSPLELPFHEVFYYNDFQTVKRRLNGTPRLAIQRALATSSFYLQCECCKEIDSDTGSIKSSHPDICILYKLHLECGKLINLYDWLQAFITVIDPSLIDTKKKKSALKKKLEEQLHARFIRGVSELQFLGFIKATLRKTDHVSRLTWGGC
ncbi:origin recognition complex subunit 3 isoform X1 [Hydra vulgaris]|uniref:origin recognition complex subunit 3 isoform X1 n=1 Tax=Hydra vulgaris TaxID=6087 RepID=UPI001F5FB980|nr:origin recognition complex subunit 3 isoform X1 [Hydra vulgaris]XP_047128145.1 origin recognition complex subunit 3 isoform X1 [Hydra vulgaris]XP_047128146.1 origin recognition complex subunit 3 isoform X1 [Hydra vulgaris]XP_047128147.1 origin recognition complex subunit 3 isoform X1 [Hydra vulgaris]